MQQPASRPNASAAGSESQGKKESRAVQDTKRLGFRALLGWHYLILFAPLLVSGGTKEITHVLVSRQLVLYITLALSFAFLFFATLRSQKGRDAVLSSIAISCACAVGAIATLMAGFTYGMPAVYFAVTVTLGMSEALLMLAWLLFFIELLKKQAYRTLGLDMITGSLIAILVESLISPANFVVAACLPLLSAASFLALKHKYRASKECAEDADGERIPYAQLSPALKRHYRASYLYLIRRSVPAGLFALSLGLVQGSFLEGGIPFLVTFSPSMFVGMTIAGIIIFFTRERFCTHADIDSVYRFSLIFFTVGIAVLILAGTLSGGFEVPEANIPLTIAAISVFAGFNLFDFGNMMLCLGIARSSGREFDYFVSGGRFVVYVFMAVGYVVGIEAMSHLKVASDLNMIVAVCCVALLVLVSTASVSSTSAEDYIVLLLGAGSDDAIPGETADRVLARLCSSCSSSDSCTIRPVLQSGISALAQASAKAEKLNEELTKLEDAQKRQAEAAMLRNDNASGQGPGSVPSRRMRMPWRDACDEVARRYRLSKRETQIFMLISKGRNAEYVSQELVISIHTAKTHIANIYQKLDVHSSQEMLDLIDTFRAYADEESKKEE